MVGERNPQGKLLGESYLPRMMAAAMEMSDAQSCLLALTSDFQDLKKKKVESIFTFPFPSQFCSSLLNRCSKP